MKRGRSKKTERVEKGLAEKWQVGGRTQGTDVGPSLPVSRKYARGTCSVFSCCLVQRGRWGKYLFF